VAVHIRHQHHRNVPAGQGGSIAPGPGRLDHQHQLGELRPAKPTLLPYATTKGAIANFTAGLAQMLGDRGIRVNAVAPGPIWTPLIPSTMPPEQIAEFGANTPLGRAGEPKEVAPAYVLLASEEASYISGAVIPVTGGKPIL
jgi:NAD(P)-dependent dehydrogenase (short-subunit alcohol dehydrogenase family)